MTPRPPDGQVDVTPAHAPLARAALLVASLLATGCASITGPERYPTDWAPLEAAASGDDCPRLSGRYSDEASGAFPAARGKPPRLSEMLASLGQPTPSERRSDADPQAPAAPAAASVSIEQTPDRLSFIFASSDGRETRSTFRRYHFSWSDGRTDDVFNCYRTANGARLGFFSRNLDQEGYFIASTSVDAILFLLKASDGSLVLQYRTDTLTISQVLIGTSFHASSVWWRYPPLIATR